MTKKYEYAYPIYYCEILREIDLIDHDYLTHNGWWDTQCLQDYTNADCRECKKIKKLLSVLEEAKNDPVNGWILS